MTIKEAAAQLKCTESDVLILIETGILKARKVKGMGGAGKRLDIPIRMVLRLQIERDKNKKPEGEK